MTMGWVELIAGLAILVGGGEFLVKSTVRLALYLKISPMVIGLTIVSFGTSFPELVVSVGAVLGGHPDISIGNVVGSNIANLALVLGLTAIVFPMSISRTSMRFDWPIMLIATLLMIAFSVGLLINRWEGLFFVGALALYNWWVIRKSRKQTKAELAEVEQEDADQGKSGLTKALLILVGSIAALIFGADLLVDGAVTVARSFGVEERVIAVTIIAFGTSAPELATSIISVYRKEEGIGIGNLIGSNIFNVLGILGLTAVVKPVDINPAMLEFDYWWCLGIPLLLYPVMLVRRKVTRLEGSLLMVAYISYIVLLF